ncbi:hypothetical protein QP471_25295, partial [Klebsiella quasivariicola]
RRRAAPYPGYQIAQRSSPGKRWRHQDFPGGGALHLVRATKSHSAVAPVSVSATGDFPGGGALRLVRATKSHNAVAPVSASAIGDVEAIQDR